MKKITAYILLIITTVILSTFNSKSSELLSNFDILDSLSKKAAIEIIHRLEQNHADSLIIEFAQHNGTWIIEQHLLKAGKISGKLFFTHHQNKLSLLTVNIKEMNVGYSLHKNDDSLSRKINLVIANTLEKQNGILYGLPEINLVWKDDISRDDLLFVENSPYPFTKGKIPEPERTFFEKIAEPVIFISTAIVTIALLFSVRSG